MDAFEAATFIPAPALLWIFLIERLYVVRHVVKVDSESGLLEKLNAVDADLSVFGNMVIWIVLLVGGIVFLPLLNAVNTAPLDGLIYLGHYYLLQAHPLLPTV